MNKLTQLLTYIYWAYTLYSWGMTRYLAIFLFFHGKQPGVIFDSQNLTLCFLQLGIMDLALEPSAKKLPHILKQVILHI